MGEKLHKSDWLVLNGHHVPDDLMPLDRLAGSIVPRVLRAALELSVEQRAEVRVFADSLPQHGRTQPAQMPTCFDLYLRSVGPGALVMRLIANRNLHPSAVARAISYMTEGRRCWAASTYNMIGGGRKELTPDLLGDLAILLDIPADVLATLTGITPVGTPMPGLGDIIWAARRLTSAQVQEVLEFAEAMIRPR